MIGVTDDARQEAGDNRNDAEWVKESVIEDARETGKIVGSGAWIARPVEGKDRIDVYRFEERV